VLNIIYDMKGKILMRDFFSLEGPFNKYGGMVADMLILSLMWFIFSIPIITIGASTTALFFVTTRRIAEREGYITGDFWSAFKTNFKRATIIWLIVLAFASLIVFNLFLIAQFEVGGILTTVIFPAQLILMLQLVFISIYLFPMTARFEMTIKETIKTSFFMANRHLLTTITCVIMLAIIAYFSLIFGPFVLFIGPGVYAMLASYSIMRVFKKYRPEMDKDPLLEIQEIEAQKAEDRRARGISMLEDEDAPDIISEENV